MYIRLRTYRHVYALTLILIVLLYPFVLSAAVYLTPKEALKQFFLHSEVVRTVEKELDTAALTHFKKELGYALKRDKVTFYIGETGGKIDGYALIEHQIGKTQPITFMMLINPHGEIEQIEVLVYRESHGSEVRHQRFLKQFYQKNIKSPLKVDRDIINISGATLSVRAVTIGVKRALILWNYFFEPLAGP